MSQYRQVRRAAGAVAILLVGIVTAGPAAVRRTLSTRFVEVLVEGVPLASRYVLEGRTVDLLNGSDIPLRVRFDADRPQPSEMRVGYAPIPDAAWIGFEPREFTVEPGRTATGKVVLYLPDDPAHIGKRYQAMLLLRTDSNESGMVRMGLRPRLLFSVGPRAGEGGGARLANPVPFGRIQPYSLVTADASIVLACGSFEFENPRATEMACELFADPASAERIDLGRADVLARDASWVEFSPHAVVLAPGTKAQVAVTARVPVAAEHLGRTYVMPVRSTVRFKGEPPVEGFNKVQFRIPAVAAGSATTTVGAGRRDR